MLCRLQAAFGAGWSPSVLLHCDDQMIYTQQGKKAQIKVIIDLVHAPNMFIYKEEPGSP